MEPLNSMCLEVNAYLERKRQNPDIPYAQPRGSFNESQKCGCRYCYVACQSVGGLSDEDRNKAVNREAVLKNSELGFGQTNDGEVEKDRIVDAEFRSSGLKFGKSSSSREVFVLDSEYVGT
jgi:MinD superfamily P-loop ATPase